MNDGIGTEPEWLVRWRERRRQIDPDAVSTTLEPFGVTRKNLGQLAKMAGAIGLVFVFVSGTPFQRNRVVKRFSSWGVRHISYSASVAEARENKASPSEYQTRGLAWSIVRASVSTALGAGHTVVVDAEFAGRDEMRRFNEHCFLSGARGVIAICFTTMYEEGWDDDGFTGVVWVAD